MLFKFVLESNAPSNLICTPILKAIFVWKRCALCSCKYGNFYQNIAIDTQCTNMLKRRKESDTYVDAVRRHRLSRQIMLKIGKILELSASIVTFISWRGRLLFSWWKPQCWLKAPVFDLFSSWSVYGQQPGRCRSPSFFLTYFYHFTFPGFPFILIQCTNSICWNQGSSSGFCLI